MPSNTAADNSAPILSAHLREAGPGMRPVPDPARYVASEDLRRAVNVAVTLGMPLLITGEPGTGKTQLGYRLAWELDRQRPLLRFDTKSTSVASDLFYQFDSVRHYAASQLAAVTTGATMPEPRASVTVRALGLAILRTRPWQDNRALVSDQQATRDHLKDAEPMRSVVLIDEIDKAPRDFPNDLLNQIEDYSFDMPDLPVFDVAADKNLRPIVVITSNSERQLPEAFLRRCVYHHITLPKDKAQRDAWMDSVLHEHFGASMAQRRQDEAGLQDALSAYWSVRDRANVVKPPSTSELLDWLRALMDPHAAIDLARPLGLQVQAVLGLMGTLMKTADDLLQAPDVLARLRPAATAGTR